MEYKKYYLTLSFLLPLILCLPSCTRIVDWAKCNFYQGEPFCFDYDKVRCYIRGVSAYDQLATIAHFDVLWLHADVRKEYVEVYGNMSGKSAEQKALLLKRQEDEANHFIMFYALTPYEIPLGTAESIWNVLLKIDNNYFDPIEIKEVELSPIYKAYFGERFTRFKKAYQIKFDAKDVHDALLITPTTPSIEIYFRSVEKELVLTWCIPPVKTEEVIVEQQSVDAPPASLEQPIKE